MAKKNALSKIKKDQYDPNFMCQPTEEDEKIADLVDKYFDEMFKNRPKIPKRFLKGLVTLRVAA